MPHLSVSYSPCAQAPVWAFRSKALFTSHPFSKYSWYVHSVHSEAQGRDHGVQEPSSQRHLCHHSRWPATPSSLSHTRPTRLSLQILPLSQIFSWFSVFPSSSFGCTHFTLFCFWLIQVSIFLPREQAPYDQSLGCMYLSFPDSIHHWPHTAGHRGIQLTSLPLFDCNYLVENYHIKKQHNSKVSLLQYPIIESFWSLELISWSSCAWRVLVFSLIHSTGLSAHRNHSICWVTVGGGGWDLTPWCEMRIH